jgi:hypothetical protein
MMKRTIGCPRESEVIDAVTSGIWAAGTVMSQINAELRKHAVECRVCSYLLDVASAVHDERASALRTVNVPPASLVWWRNELRTKREAVRKAESPISVVHAIAVACLVGVFVAVGRPMLPIIDRLFLSTIALMGEFAPLQNFNGLLPSASSPLFLVALAALGCCLMIVPFAIYFILSDK